MAEIFASFIQGLFSQDDNPIKWQRLVDLLIADKGNEDKKIYGFAQVAICLWLV